MSAVMITLPIIKQFGAKEITESWTLPLSKITIGDWTIQGRTEPMPNRAKIDCSGKSYCVAMGRDDLQKQLEAAGVTIIKLETIKQ